MKKLILICILGVVATSCTKEYTCNCTTYWKSDGSVAGTSSQVIKKSKSDAEQKCSETEAQGNTQTLSRTCNLE